MIQISVLVLSSLNVKIDVCPERCTHLKQTDRLVLDVIQTHSDELSLSIDVEPFMNSTH